MPADLDSSGVADTTCVQEHPQLLRSGRVFFNIIRGPAVNGTSLRHDSSHFTQRTQEMTIGFENIDIKKDGDFEKLGLTGRIISVVPQLPSAIAISEDDEAQLTPRPFHSSMYDSLEYLSVTPQWEHTIVGWTGEIFSARDPEFERLRIRNNIGSNLEDPRSEIVAQGQKHPSISGSHFSRRFSENDRVTHCTAAMQRKIEDTLAATHNSCETIPIWLGEQSTTTDGTIMLGDQNRWTRFTNEMVWPILHNEYPTLPQNFHSVDTVFGEMTQKYYGDHKTMIKEYVKAILKVYKPGDIIWIHDYQLMVLSNELRQKLPEAHIAYFHHTNWPTYDFFEVLPEWKAHISGILRASVIGVQHQDYKDQILELCDRKMAVQDMPADMKAGELSNKIVVASTGTDFAAVHEAARKQGRVYERTLELKAISDGKKVIAARARLDNVKGIRATLKGFGHYLEKYPKSRDEVVLVLITTSGEIERVADPADKGLSRWSNDDIGLSEPAEVITENWIKRLIDTINDDLGSDMFSSIIHIPQYVSPSQYFALLRIADLGLVTTHDSGTNTIAMEFIACQEDKNSPLLISNLSCMGKTLSDKGGAIAVNPFDPESVSNGIVQGFNMGAEEKERRHQNLTNQVNHTSIVKWTNVFLIKACEQFVLDASRLNMEKLGEAYASSPKKLLVFDYDGTLTPLVDDPEAAIPTQSVLDSIVTLSSNPNTEVWLVSGRSKVFLEKHFGHIKSIGLSAEHGCFMRRPGTEEWISLTESMDMGWHAVAGKVFDQLAEEISGSEVERKEVAIVWHYRNADQAVGLRVAREKQAELEDLLRDWDVEIGLGSNIVEVKPKSLNKGVIVSRLVAETFDSEKGFVFCAGDDTTDEDMFRALLHAKQEHVFPCLVSVVPKKTLARYRVSTPADIERALGFLL